MEERTVTVALAAMLVASISGCGIAGTARPNHAMPFRREIAGVRLVSAPSPVRQGCVDAARRLGVVIYCPNVVPVKWGKQMLVCAGCNGTFDETGSFPAPREYVGPPGEKGIGHFTVWAATRKLIRLGYVGCPGIRPIGHARITGIGMATWISCPPGSGLDGGHVILLWSKGGWTYAVSLHGDTAVNRRILRVIGAHMARIVG